MSLDWTNGEFVNGPKLAAWLKERDRLPEGTKHKDELDWLRRRITYWEKGEQASLAAVDRWLTYIGCHLSEIPDDLWEPRKKRRHSSHSTPERRAMVLAWMDSHGASLRATAEHFDMSDRTVRSWHRRATA